MQILNGEKNWVFNGSFANYFIVFAVTKTILVRGVKQGKLSAFFVNEDSPGIMIKKYDTDVVNITDVAFNDIAVPVGKFFQYL